MASRISYIICTVLIAYCAFFYYPKWEAKAGESSLGWDAASYYWYLPATFIYQDLKQQEFGDSIIAKYDFTPEFEQSYVHESGNRVITYSSGLAFMHLPAFVAGHVIAKATNYPADGFSMPYQVAVQLWSLLWALIGLWFFRRLLLHYYSDQVTAITLILLVFGSNYLNYAGFDVTLTHAWLFTIYVFLILNTRLFYKAPSAKYAMRIGLLTGLAILIRPSDMVAALIPLLWGMETIRFSAIKERLSFFKRYFKFIAIAVVCTIAVGSIQVIYWLYVTGQPLVYSYADKGFSWLHPHFKDYTFSYRSGWLMYTPLLILAFVGLIPYLWKGKNKVAVIIFFLLNYYIVAAWDVWWYGGMGGRAMVQSYAVLFFPIATLVEFALGNKWFRWPIFAAMAFFAYINIWFTYNAHRADGLYDPDDMTKEYYWHVIGRPVVPAHVELFKDTDEYYSGEPVNLKEIYYNGFEGDTTESDIYPISGERSAYFHLQRTYGPPIQIPLQNGAADWLRASVKVRVMDYEPENWKMLQYIIEFLKDGQPIKHKMIRLNRWAKKDSTKQVSYDVKIPDEPFDAVKVIFWNPGSNVPAKIDDVRISTFEE